MKHLLILMLALLLIGTVVQAQQPVATPKPVQPVAMPKPVQPAAGPATTQPTAPAPAPVQGLADELDCRVLTGRVTDRFDYPLTGASVMLRSRNRALSGDAYITNSEGKYMVTANQAIPRNTVLEVTAAGYSSIEIPLANCKPLDVTLEPLPGTRFKSDGRIKKTKLTGKIH
ncbi:carboxypeptidase regulatory-like domain-containing protein [Hymenobacter terricola]|uniref:carboxypeptidase regulatory-like domain-containing protein n=1 Tax=Hymenobacter terricola TaxID=2819236 RepID=UPI001B309C7A|nr:carboxypeptidase regulatory-like domain-containing protein [Hymenobacter terricola]